jgi:ABC-type cobalamin/Fe3+-siderophores transport system ATPase subunit
MKLLRFTVHNFRSVRHAEVTTPSYTLLVGANNAGKSTLVDAIRAFYEHEKFKFKADRDLPHNLDPADLESWIEVTYELTDEEREDLPGKYQLPNNHLRLKKWFDNAPEGRDAGTIYGYESEEDLSTDSLFGAANVQRGRLGTVIYIPAVSKVDDHTKLSGPSALRDTIDELLGAVVADSPAYANFRTQFEQFSESMRDSATHDGRSLRGFEAQLSEELSTWETGFRLNFAPPASKDITKNLIDWELTDAAGTPAGHSVEQFGSGFQRHFIASLIRTRAAFQTRPRPSARRQFSPNLTLVLFEEPEAYLHPPQQAALANNLRAIVSQASWQVIASTHSPQFVSRNTDELNSIVRVRRDAGISSCFQLRQTALDRIFSTREELERLLGHWAEMDEEERADLERIRYFLWLDNERSSLFFCDFVLLVEGATETALFTRLLDDGRLLIPGAACGTLHSDGKYNTVRFMRLLNAFGLPFVVIHDRDTGGRHDALNELIRQEAEDAEFARGVVVLEPDLENYLGWIHPDGQRSGLKPGVALWNYEQRGGETPRLAELCQRISDVIPPAV